MDRLQLRKSFCFYQNGFIDYKLGSKSPDDFSSERHRQRNLTINRQSSLTKCQGKSLYVNNLQKTASKFVVYIKEHADDAFRNRIVL